jgi:hypothetical protein
MQLCNALATSLGSVDEHLVKHFVAIVMIAIGMLLALDTKLRPWNRGEPFWTNFLFAMDTDSKRIIFNPAKSRSDVSQQVRFSIEIAYRELSLRGVLDFIQRVCAFLDNDSIAVTNAVFQLRPLALENFFEFA